MTFELQQQLGRGGMGVVWKARDTETGEIVALKLLHSLFAEDADYVARFEREVELGRRIDSPNVVKVLGFGRREGVPFLAMEYIDGPSLRERLKERGRYAWAEAKPLLLQMAQALEAAHAAGIVHRDVKPSNILIAPDGTLKLADFGIARAGDLTSLTGTSTLMGTAAYMAPEGQRDERSDLYSLGCVAYEMLSGEQPFPGTTPHEVVARQMAGPPDMSPIADGSARKVVSWLLARAAADRPQTASALVAVLEGSSRVPVVRRGVARKPVLAGMAVAAVAVVVAAGVGLGLAMGGGGGSSTPVVAGTHGTTSTPEPGVSPSPTGAGQIIIDPGTSTATPGASATVSASLTAPAPITATPTRIATAIATLVLNDTESPTRGPDSGGKVIIDEPEPIQTRTRVATTTPTRPPSPTPTEVPSATSDPSGFSFQDVTVAPAGHNAYDVTFTYFDSPTSFYVEVGQFSDCSDPFGHVVGMPPLYQRSAGLRSGDGVGSIHIQVTSTFSNYVTTCQGLVLWLVTDGYYPSMPFYNGVTSILTFTPDG